MFVYKYLALERFFTTAIANLKQISDYSCLHGLSYGNPSGKFIYCTPIAVFLFWRMCKNNLKSSGIWVFRTLELRLFM